MLNFPEVYDKIRCLLPPEAQNYESNQVLLRDIFKKSRSLNWDELFGNDVMVGVSEESCVKLKEIGTKCFQNNKLMEAVSHYNEYLRLCQKLGKDCSTKRHHIYQGYANRSAVLFRAQEYSLCLEDIQGALYFGDKNPNTEYILFDRSAKCYLFLGKTDFAKEHFSAALDKIKQSTDVNEKLKSVFIAQTEANLKKIVDEEFGSNEITKKSSYLELKTTNSDHAGLTAKAKVCYADDRGRYLVATEDISPGDIIAVEAPCVLFAHFDKTSNLSKVCHHCMQPFHETPRVFYPSPFVDGIAFCSFSCYQVACQSYHKHETYIWRDYLDRIKESADEIEKSGCLFLAFRSVVKHEASFLVEAVSTFLKEDPKYGVEKCDDDDEKEEQVQLMNLYNLVNHETSMTDEEKIRTAIRSVILLQSLMQTQYFSARQTDDSLTKEMDTVMFLLYRFQLGITYNVHLVYQVTGDLSGDIPLGMVGSGVYQDLVLINHSCAPNTTRFFHGNKMILVAKRFIHCGEEITNNYGIHHNNQSKDSRKANLLEGYKFDCNCEACTLDYPLLLNVNAQISSKLSKQLDALLSQYQHFFKSGDLNNAKISCWKYLSKLEQSNIKYPHKMYEIGAIALNSCFWGIIASEQ